MHLCPCSLPRCLTTAVGGGRHATHCLFSLLSSSSWPDWWYFPASKSSVFCGFNLWVTLSDTHCTEFFNYLTAYRIIHTTLVLSMESFEPFAGYYFFNVLLMVLQALHIFWAGLILRMVYKFLGGKVGLQTLSDLKRETLYSKYWDFFTWYNRRLTQYNDVVFENIDMVLQITVKHVILSKYLILL